VFAPGFQESRDFSDIARRQSLTRRLIPDHEIDSIPTGRSLEWAAMRPTPANPNRYPW
jgi:hypothetical protein